jgi:hypothetical protein
MFEIDDWVLPKRGLLPIDSERNRKKPRGRQIISADSLQIKEMTSSGGELRLTFRGCEGQYLAAFFDPAPKGGEKKDQT